MTSAPIPVGRPPSLPDEDRKQLILQAAEGVFDTLGYGDATMEEVARACGMAKKTVYKFFPDKASLFGALVDSHDMVAVSDSRIPAGLGQTRIRLGRLLEELSTLVLSPRQITLTRLVIAESVKYPELAQRFYRDCVEKTQTHVTQVLIDDPSLGLPQGVDPRIIADMFVSTILGTLHLRALMLNMQKADLERELGERIAFAIDMITRTFAVS